MSVELVLLPRFPDERGDVLELTEAETVTVAADDASDPLPGGTYRLLAVGGDFRVKAGPEVENGANGTRLVEGLPDTMVIRDGNKLGVSAA